MKPSFKKSRHSKFSKKFSVVFIKEIHKIDGRITRIAMLGIYSFIYFLGKRPRSLIAFFQVKFINIWLFFYRPFSLMLSTPNPIGVIKSWDKVNLANKNPRHIILMNMTSMGNSPLFKYKANNFTVARESFYLKKFISYNQALFFSSLIVNYFLPTIEIDEAFTVRSSTNMNYFHWMIEDLPRILLFYSDKKNWHIPLLINHDAHENIIFSLARLSPHVTIYSVSSFRNVHARKFHTSQYISDIPFDVKKMKLAAYKDFDAYIKISRKSLLPIINYYMPKEPYTKNVRNLKLFIVPSSPNRLIYNIGPVIKTVKSMNYQTLVLENHSIFEQAKFFHQATSIVSFSGAALTNLIFCKPSCHVHILFGDYPFRSNSLWTKLASSSSKCKVKNWILGGGQKDTHGGFIVDLLLFKKILSLSDQ